MRDLSVTLIQCELAWEQPADNRQQIGNIIGGLDEIPDLIVLPEMFTTGFSMNALANAEKPGGATEQWLRELAQRHDCALTGSIAVEAGEGVYNRMLFSTPEGVQHYDKRHLFRMAGEHKRYRAGQHRVVVTWRGWRILLQVCYDLRFPVWSRNLGDYDMLLYVANWPGRRRSAWQALLRARAIENLSYVLGVNRVGSDGNGVNYSGDSVALDFLGNPLNNEHGGDSVETVVLDRALLEDFRESFPAHLDADGFELR